MVKIWGYLRRAALVSTLTTIAAAGVADVSFMPSTTINSYSDIDNVAHHEVLPEVATDGNGNWLTLWATTEQYRYYSLPVPGLHVSHSADMGETWGDRYSFDLDVVDSRGVIEQGIVYAGNGRWIICWSANMGVIKMTSSMDNGQTWTAPYAIVTGIFPQLTSDGAGNVILMYRVLGETPDFRMIRSTDAGQTWLPETSIPTPGSNLSHLANITAGGNGKWYINYVTYNLDQWDDIYESVYNTLSSSDNGASWQPTGTLITRGNAEESLAFGARGDQVLIASRTRVDGVDYGFYVYVSSDSGLNFTHVELDNEASGHASVAHDAAGNWVIVSENGSYDFPTVKAWSSSNGHEWNKEFDLQSTVTETRHPSVAGGSPGHFLAAWESKNDSVEPLYRDADIHVSASADSGLTWTAPDALSPSNFPTDYSYVHDKSVQLTGNGDTLVASWTALADMNDNPFNNEQTLMASRSTDHGQTWSDAIMIADKVGRGENLPPIYNGEDNWVLPWKKSIGTTVSAYVTSENNGLAWSTPKFVDFDIISSNGNGVLLKVVAGQIERSVDNGATWQSGAKTIIADVQFLVHVEGSEWIAVGPGGATERISNNGDSTAFENGLTNLAGMYSITTDHNGHLIATGSQSNSVNLSATVYTSVSIDGGATWSYRENILTVSDSSLNDIYLVKTPEVQARPEVYWLGGDRWVLVAGVRSSYYDGWYAGPFYQNSKIYVAFTNSGGQSWSSPEQVLTLPVRNESSFVGLDPPDYALTGGEVAIAVPIRSNSDGDFDIYYQRIEATAYTAARDWQLYQ